MSDRFLEPHQAQTTTPTDFENRLGDTIEDAYAAGIHDVEGIVAHLAKNGPPPPTGEVWTAATFTTLMAELGN